MKQSPMQTLLLCLKYDFPTEWAAFVNGGGCSAPFQGQRSTGRSCPITSMKKVSVFGNVDVFGQNAQGGNATASEPSASAITGSLLDAVGATLSLPGSLAAMAPNLGNPVYVVIGYTSSE